jgi:hypothetical protein
LELSELTRLVDQLLGRRDVGDRHRDTAREIGPIIANNGPRFPIA